MQNIAGKNFNRKSVIIFLGDGRSNYTHPQVEILKKIARKTKKIIWLNPEPRYGWNLGDCIINLYAPYCSSVEEVRTPEQLYKVLVNKI